MNSGLKVIKIGNDCVHYILRKCFSKTVPSSASYFTGY